MKPGSCFPQTRPPAPAFLLKMTQPVVVGVVRFQKRTLIAHLLLSVLVGNINVGSTGESEPSDAETVPTSPDELTPQQHSFTTVPPQSQYDSSEPGGERPASAAPEVSDLPPHILTAAHLPSLQRLVSHEKITVRIGLRLSLTGPRYLLDPEVLLSLQETVFYSTGGAEGLFTMRVVEIKNVSSAP